MISYRCKSNLFIPLLRLFSGFPLLPKIKSNPLSFYKVLTDLALAPLPPHPSPLSTHRIPSDHSGHLVPSTWIAAILNLGRLCPLTSLSSQFKSHLLSELFPDIHYLSTFLCKTFQNLIFYLLIYLLLYFY